VVGPANPVVAMALAARQRVVFVRAQRVWRAALSVSPVVKPGVASNWATVFAPTLARRAPTTYALHVVARDNPVVLEEAAGAQV